ncbi:MAG: hypothetical protein WBL45_08650 [Solirubrobacterales bacterium]
MLIKITARQVEALNNQALDHLSGLNDLLLALHAGDHQKAAELGRAFADDLRLLLDVLGWPDRVGLSAEDVVELTMPPDLRRAIERLRDEAAELYAATLPRSNDEREVLERTTLAVDACGRVLREIECGPEACAHG